MKLIKRDRSTFPSVWNDLLDNDWFGIPNVIQTGTSVPAVNIKETADGYEIQVAAPGLNKNDFNVDYENDILSISAEEKTENSKKDEDGNFTRREFSYRSFKRNFNLPDTISGDKIQASYKDGVLLISLPKKEEAKPKPARTITIG